MATVTLQFLLKEMRASKLPFYRVSDNATVIAENDTEENIDSAIRSLEEVLAEIQNPFVDVKICDSTKAVIGRGGNKQVYRIFRIGLNTQSKPISGVEMDSKYLKLMEENNKLQRQLERLEDQKKYDELVRRMDEMSQSDVLTKIFSHPKFLEGIGGLFGIKQPMGLAAVDSGEPVNVSAVERQEKIRTAINRLCKVDLKFDETISMLADLADSNRQQYFEAVKVLESMQS